MYASGSGVRTPPPDRVAPPSRTARKSEKPRSKQRKGKKTEEMQGTGSESKAKNTRAKTTADKK